MLVKIIFNEAKKETHAVFKHTDTTYLYQVYAKSTSIPSKNEEVALKKIDHMFGQLVRDLNGDPVESGTTTSYVHRFARADTCDNYDRYVGAAVVVAEEIIGSKTQLVKDCKSYNILAMHDKEASLSTEEFAVRIVTQRFGTFEKFKDYVNRHSTFSNK